MLRAAWVEQLNKPTSAHVICFRVLRCSTNFFLVFFLAEELLNLYLVALFFLSAC